MEKGVYIFILISSSLLLEFAFTSKYKGNFCLFFQYISLTSSYSGSKSISWPHPSFPVGFDLQLYVCVCVKLCFSSIKNTFIAVSDFQQDWVASAQNSHILSIFIYTIVPTTDILYLSGIFVITHEPVYTGQSLSPKAIVHIRVHC